MIFASFVLSAQLKAVYHRPVSRALTRRQLESRKERAARFVRDILGDPERADEIDEENADDYAK
ncbi:MAG TPA: hypothetical protein VMI32_07175 [Candidatus Solibacter sp.]|nr:hypothetical protein [Candidatus Solibacter sp.]